MGSLLESFSQSRQFEYENGYYLTSDVSRLGKLIAHYELYKKIVDLPGEIVECGVFKGASLIRFATFRHLLESPFSRKILGFDTFGRFPQTDYEPDQKPRESFIIAAGECGISQDDLRKVLTEKGIPNFELIEGDINQTVPDYVENNPQLKIALLHIDTDIYEPAVTILHHLYPQLVRGGVVLFDDYGVFPGETQAVDEFFNTEEVIIRKLPFTHIPAYIIKT